MTDRVFNALPVTVHWSFADPVAFQGTEDQQRATFKRVLLEMTTRISYFVNLPIERLDRLSLQQQGERSRGHGGDEQGR